MPEESTTQLGFRLSKQGDEVATTTSKLTKEKIDEFADEYNIEYRSDALRILIVMGLRANEMLDPREFQDASTADENVDNSDSAKIRDFVPAGSDNAVDVRDELVDRIESDLLEVVQDDPELHMDGWEVYRDEG